MVIRRSIIVALFLLSGYSLLSAQESTGNLIFFDALSFSNNSELVPGRVDLYIAIPYRALDFSRGSSGFSARYRVRLLLKGEEGTIYDTSWTRSVETTDYDRTTGGVQAFEFFQQRVPVMPGEYSARLEVLDYGTNFTSNASRSVSVIDFSVYRFALSGLMLVSKIRETDGGHTISPLLTTNVSLLKDGYFVFFETYNYTGEEDFDFTAIYRLEDDGEVDWRETWEKKVPEGRSQQWLRLPVDGFNRGEYIVEVLATKRGDTTDTLAAAKRVVSFRGTAEGMPLSEGELTEKIKRLRYVATQSEIDFIEDGGTFAEKRRRYADFWSERDPTPGTPANESMIEYFRRIDYANKNYRSYAEGWLTDMGRIYIVYGPPDRIERDPFASDGKPRETWEYYSRRLSLLFVDQTGFGDFRLQTPVPLSEKYR